MPEANHRSQVSFTRQFLPWKAERIAEDAKIPEDLGSVRLQFVDQSTGKPTGSVVAVPVKDATVKNLETLLNTIQGNVRKRKAIDTTVVYACY